jgi:thiol-disulfide isomerase/thioredoxin
MGGVKFLRTVLGVKLLRFLLPALLLAGCVSSGSSGLMSVELENLKGDKVSLLEADSGVVVVNFWASYCKPCLREMPALEQAFRADNEVRFIGVNIADEPERVQQMIEKTGVSYEIWLDHRGDAMVEAGVRSLPGTLIIKDGEIVYKKIGEITSSEITSEIQKAKSR